MQNKYNVPDDFETWHLIDCHMQIWEKNHHIVFVENRDRKLWTMLFIPQNDILALLHAQSMLNL